MDNSGSKRTASERLAANVVHLRQIAGITQGELAERLTQIGHPMQFNTVSKIERAARPVTIEDLEALSRVLGVRAVDLLLPPLLDQEQRFALARKDVFEAESEVRLAFDSWVRAVDELVRCAEGDPRLETIARGISREGPDHGDVEDLGDDNYDGPEDDDDYDGTEDD
jgi:transcriptional regulator with XRE-family HTH domain